MNEDLIKALTDSINKKYKGYDVAHILGEAGEKAATNVKNWISTGATLLDLAISNRRNGGVASGKILELTGAEGSGKSLIGAHILASTQKMGGIAVYIDTESAVSVDFLKVIGVDVDKLIYIQLETIEEIYATIEKIILNVKEKGNDKLVSILVDSVAAATTEVEKESDYTKDGWATSKAIINSKAMRKITNMIAKENVALILTNQLRTKLGAMMFSDNNTTSGGVAIAYHSSTRIRLAKALKIKDRDKEVIGLYIKARIDKSRFGPSYRTVEFPLYFSSGIDDDGSLLIYLKNKKLIKSSGAWYSVDYLDKDTGEVEEIKFQAKTWSEKLKSVKGLREYVIDLISDNFIMKYEINDGNISVDELEVEEDLDLEDNNYNKIIEQDDE